jgi:hypothetical protein
MGDWLRGEQGAVALVPGWLRVDEFAPAALAKAAAGALRAFEGAQPDALAPRGAEAVGLNIRGAAALLGLALHSARAIAVEHAGETARVASLRRALASSIARVRAGELSRLAEAAPDTLASTRSLLAASPAELASRLVPVQTLAVGEERAFVFLVDPANGDVVVSLLYDQHGGRAELRRVDFFTISQAYRTLYGTAAERGGTP